MGLSSFNRARRIAAQQLEPVHVEEIKEAQEQPAVEQPTEPEVPKKAKGKKVEE